MPSPPRPVADRAIFAGLCAAIVVSRLPFLSTASAGLDPDAWRIALAARHLATTGEYLASRFPSYPVHEIGSALGWALGGLGGLNGLTILFSGIAAGFFGLILRRLEVKGYLLGGLAFAFVPVVYINSLFAMDYVWSLAIVLGSLYFALREQPGIAGVGLGLAIGTRLTAGAMVIPLVWLLAMGGRPREDRTAGRNVLHFAFVASVVAGLCYLPPLLVYGPDFLRFYDGALPLRIAVHRATLDVWGEIGFAAVGAAVLWALVRPRPLAAPRRHVEWALLGGIGLYAMAFVRLPLESGYLMPVVPLGLAWLGLRLPDRGFGALCIALLLSPFLLDLEADSSLPPVAMEPAFPLHIGSGEMRLLALGPVFTERARVQHETDSLRGLADALRGLPRPAIVLADGLSAKLDVTLGDDAEGLVIVPSLDWLWEERAADPLSLRWPSTEPTSRWPLYVLPGVEPPSGSDPRLAGRRPIPVPYPAASRKRRSTSSRSG
ncbi:MAG: hypothetical protein ABJF88_02700 [Rhodothermales bacterium]